MSETMQDMSLSRLRWQCRRGMLELDALLGDFVSVHYLQMEDAQKKIFHEILDYPDQLLFDYFFGTSVPTNKDVADVIKRIQQSVTPVA